MAYSFFFNSYQGWRCCTWERHPIHTSTREQSGNCCSWRQNPDLPASGNDKPPRSSQPSQETIYQFLSDRSIASSHSYSRKSLQNWSSPSLGTFELLCHSDFTLIPLRYCEITLFRSPLPFGRLHNPSCCPKKLIVPSRPLPRRVHSWWSIPIAMTFSIWFNFHFPNQSAKLIFQSTFSNRR
jgi:hypothetical protein